MDASTFEIKTPCLTGGRSHTPLAKTERMIIGLNYYTPGRKNKLHTHPGEDHAFLVLDGEATFYDKEEKPTVVKKGEGIMLPEGWYYWFQSTGKVPLALYRVSARTSKPKIRRVDVEGNQRDEDEEGYQHVDGEPIAGQFWEMK